MKGPFAEELAVARRLAREAGALILGYYGKDTPVRQKPGEGGPVTEADLRANDLLVEGLRRAFPGDGVVAEELADTSDASRSGRCWFVDPLDGTKEFVEGSGQFAVQIGLAVEGKACVGVVYRPVGDRMYAGAVGGPCLLETEGEERPLQFSARGEGKLRMVVSRSHRSRRIAALQKRLGVGEVIQSGSVGLKCGLLAEDVADLYVHVSPLTYRWDSCGPEAILRAAGGLLTDMSGRPYRYQGEEIQNRRGLLACSPDVFDEVLPSVVEIGRLANLID